jgi:hypothetical protein
MSTFQTRPRLPFGHRQTSSMILTALGVLIAIGITVLFLTLTGTSRTLSATSHSIPAAAGHASVSSPGTHLYSRQDKAEVAIPSGGAATASAPAPAQLRHVYVRQDKAYELLP